MDANELNEEQVNPETFKREVLNQSVILIGEAISVFLNTADFAGLRVLKAHIDQLFVECEKAIQQSKIKAISHMN